jgi:hypothetical protein
MRTIYSYRGTVSRSEYWAGALLAYLVNAPGVRLFGHGIVGSFGTRQRKCRQSIASK